MTKTRKRIVSFFLVLALVMSMVPAAFAAEIETDPEQTEETTTLPSETTEASTEPEETEPPDLSVLPTETGGTEEPANAEGQPAGDIPIMDGLSMGDVPMPLAMSGTDTGILLFNYADNGNYTTVLNSQISVTYKPNGTGSTKTAYIKNMGWHFARYNNTPYPDNPLYCIEPFRDFAASTSGNKVDRDVTLDGSGTTQGSNVWYALPQARREAIGLVLLYSDQMWNHSISVTNTSKANNPNVPLRIAKLTEIWQLLTMSPESFKGGTIWTIARNIHGTLQAIGYALLILFFVTGMVKTCGSFADMKRPEQALKVFVRFAIAKGVITHGLELMMALMSIAQGVVLKIMTAAGFSSPSPTTVPNEIVSAVEDCGFFESIPLWAVTLIGGLFVWVLAFTMILTVYGRFFKLYMYTAIAPIPLSTFAGEPSQRIGISFLKSYAAVCLEGAIIVLSCTIFSVFAASPPAVDPSAAAVTMVWSYVGELVFNMLILVGTIKMSDRIVREMMGL